MAIGIWQPQGVVIAPVSADTPGQPNVLYEANPQILSPNPDGKIFKMWFGTANGVCYAESADGLVWTRYGSNPLIPQAFNPNPKLFKHGSTYYLYAITGVGTMAAYTSSDGLAFTLRNATAITITQAWETGFIGQLGVVTVDGNGKWWGYYTAQQLANAGFAMGLVTSTDGLTWTKDASNPAITTNQPSNFHFEQIGSIFYGWSQILVPGLTTGPAGDSIPSDISRFVASAPGGPWTEEVATSTFFRTRLEEGVGLPRGQVADPCIVSVSGDLYLYYTVAIDGTNSASWQISCAKAPSTTFAQLVQGSEGVLNVPTPWGSATPSQLEILATDNFNRANQNPLAGNWTTQSTAGNLQIVSNAIEAATAGASSEAYYNALAFGNDQWSQTKVASLNTGVTSNAGLILRANTSGVRTEYTALYQCVTNQFFIQKRVAGVTTTLKNSAGLNPTPAANDVLTGCIVGTAISFYVNGNLIWTLTDSSIASGAPGMLLFAGTSVANAVLDDWAAGDFITAPTFLFSISGNVGVSGVTVSYSGDASGSVSSDGSGNYSIPSLPNGNYVITPSKTGLVFSPTSKSETVLGANLTGIDFTESAAGGGGGGGLGGGSFGFDFRF